MLHISSPAARGCASQEEVRVHTVIVKEENELQTRSGMRLEKFQSGEVDVNLLRLGGRGGGGSPAFCAELCPRILDFVN